MNNNSVKSSSTNSTLYALKTTKNNKVNKYDDLNSLYKRFELGNVKKNEFLNEINKLGFKKGTNWNKKLDDKNFNFKDLIKNLEFNRKKENYKFESNVNALDIYYSKKNPKEKFIENNDKNNHYHDIIKSYYNGQYNDKDLKNILGNKYGLIEKDIKYFKENNCLNHTKVVSKLINNKEINSSLKMEYPNFYKENTKMKRKRFNEITVQESLNYIGKNIKNSKKHQCLDKHNEKFNNGNFITWDKDGELTEKIEVKKRNINNLKLYYMKQSENYFIQNNKNIDSYKTKDIRDFKGCGNIISWG